MRVRLIDLSCAVVLLVVAATKWFDHGLLRGPPLGRVVMVMETGLAVLFLARRGRLAGWMLLGLGVVLGITTLISGMRGMIGDEGCRCLGALRVPYLGRVGLCALFICLGGLCVSVRPSAPGATA